MVQFRKSKKVGPFRFTLTPRDVSTSAGVGPIRVSRGADGKVRRTISAPGTGIYDTKVVGGKKRKARTKATPTTAVAPAGWYEHDGRSMTRAETVAWSTLLALTVPGYIFLGWLVWQLTST